MSFLDEVQSYEIGNGPRCQVEQMFAALGKKLAAEVAEALDAPRSVAKTSTIWRALKARGVEPLPSEQAINRHRRKDCRCG